MGGRANRVLVGHMTSINSPVAGLRSVRHALLGLPLATATEYRIAFLKSDLCILNGESEFQRPKQG